MGFESFFDEITGGLRFFFFSFFWARFLFSFFFFCSVSYSRLWRNGGGGRMRTGGGCSEIDLFCSDSVELDPELRVTSIL